MLRLIKYVNLLAFDPWFVGEIQKIIALEKTLVGKKLSEITKEELLLAKKLGTSDERLSELLNVDEQSIRLQRRKLGVKPKFKKVDTCAGEFESHTPYLYSTYADTDDSVPETNRRKVMILGGGPNRIGQGLEFDYCCVHASFALSEVNCETIMVNCNPETVSTDYDTSDRLYFEPLTLEDVLEIVEKESPDGVIVQYGGQTPLKLANGLLENNVPIIGTSPDSIDLAEDRERFRELLNTLNLKQAESGIATNREEALKVADKIGYPMVVRPSFVLGGRAMAIIHSDEELEKYIKESVSVSNERPVLLDRFLGGAIEVDIDAVFDGQTVLVGGIVEHIERAGVHSGDSSFILPSQTLSTEILTELEESTHALAKACRVRGLMNIQFAIVQDQVYVLEVNPRASRSVPFISKVFGIPWAKVAARVMNGESLVQIDSTKDYGNILQYQDYQSAIAEVKYVAVKESVFPFAKFRGVDTILGPEMRSTGEVMGIDRTVGSSFNRAQLGSGTKLPVEGEVFLSLKDSDKAASLSYCKQLVELGFRILATHGTAKFLAENEIKARAINKVREGSPHILDELNAGKVAMVINTPEGSGPLLDSRSIRSTTTEFGLPLYTTVAAAEAAVEGIAQIKKGEDLQVCSLQEYLS